VKAEKGVDKMKSIQDLIHIQQQAIKKFNLNPEEKTTRIVVGMSKCSIAVGAKAVLMPLLIESQRKGNEDVVVTQTGCLGMCRLEPMVEVYKDGEKTTYVEMTREKARRVFVEHINNGKIVKEYTIGFYEAHKDFLKYVKEK